MDEHTKHETEVTTPVFARESDATLLAVAAKARERGDERIASELEAFVRVRRERKASGN